MAWSHQGSHLEWTHSLPKALIHICSRGIKKQPSYGSVPLFCFWISVFFLLYMLLQRMPWWRKVEAWPSPTCLEWSCIMCLSLVLTWTFSGQMWTSICSSQELMTDRRNGSTQVFLGFLWEPSWGSLQEQSECHCAIASLERPLRHGWQLMKAVFLELICDL